jgi:SAM-dependent methyltransferase
MMLIDWTGLTRKITRSRQRAFFSKYASQKKTLDIGCGSDIYGDLFPERTTLDIAKREGVKVDIIADAHNLHMVQSASYDIVLCAEVLEHLHTPEKAIAEMRRVLKPGGLLLLTTRFIFPLHDVPQDYFRYTKYGLQHLLRDFSIETLDAEANTIETLAVLCQRIGFQCTTLGFRPLKLFWFLQAKILMLFSGMLTREYGDISNTSEENDILSSGYFVAAVAR